MDFDALLRDIGRRIAELRSARGLTQEQFAEFLDVSTVYVQRVERGRAAVSLRQLARIAEALEAEVADLFVAPATRVVRTGRPRRRKTAEPPEE